MADEHIAQLNVARLLQPIDHPATAGFVAALEPINAMADRSPGFVWRLQTDDGDATAIRIFDDPLIIINLSVWENVAALHHFVYSGAHRDIMRGRRDWFARHDEPYLVLWRIPAGHVPTVDEAVDRLRLLRSGGPGPEVFTFRHEG